MTDWRAVFQRLLADDRLSRAERKALRSLLSEEVRSTAERTVVRRLAFQAAREALTPARQDAVLTWLEEVTGLLDRPAQTAAPQAVASEAAFSPGPAPRRLIQRQLRLARRSIEVCVFTITDDRIVVTLKEAVGRGLRVRIVSDDDKSLDRGSDLERLSRSGASVRLDRSADHMHHKFGVFDGVRLLTGSYNWTRSAARGNSENVLVTDDPTLVSAYQAEFERVWGSAAAL